MGKHHVSTCRPSLDIEAVATGEVWLGSAALERGLVDALGTSDDEIQARVAEGFTAIELAPATPKKQGLAKLFEGFQGSGADMVETASARVSSVVASVWRRGIYGLSNAKPEVRVEDTRFRDS